MKKVTMLISNAFRPDPRLLKQAESLNEAGYFVTILCWDRAGELPTNEILPSGIQVERIQYARSGYGLGSRQLLRLPLFWLAVLPHLDRLHPNLVHCHDFDTLPVGLMWGYRNHIPVVYDAREYYADLVKPRLNGFTGRLLYHLIRRAELLGAHLATAVITVDETLAEIYRRQNRRVLIIGHYPSRAMISEPTPIFTYPDLNLLYIGRLSEDRGILIYLGILRQLLKNNIPTRLQLAGNFIPEVEKALFDHHAMGLESFIYLHGWISYEHMPSLLAGADLGLAILRPEPRYVAALPQKLFEYMAAGLPVVASNFPLIVPVVESSRCGLLVDPLDDPAKIAASIQELWHHPEIAKEMGMNGRRAVLSQFNWENLADQLKQLYNSLIGS